VTLTFMTDVQVNEILGTIYPALSSAVEKTQIPHTSERTIECQK